MSTQASPKAEEGPPIRLPKNVFMGHADEVWSVAYLKDNKRIVSGSRDKTIRVWNVESNKQEGQNLENEFEVRCISISPDERTLAVSGEGRVALWSFESRRVVWTKEDMDGVALSPDGKLIATMAREDIILLDAETGERVGEPLHFGDSEAYCLGFSPDGARLAAGSRNGQVRVFDAATGETFLETFKAHTDTVTSLVFTPDGNQIVTASADNTIRVWDRTTGQEVGEPMLGHESYILHISLSSDGRRLASAASDRRVRVWNVSTRRQISELLVLQSCDTYVGSHSVAWSPDGRSVVAGDDRGNISLWDVPLTLGNSDANTQAALRC